MLKQIAAGFLIGSSGIWPMMSLLSLSPASFLYGGSSGFSFLTPIIGGIFGWLFLKRNGKSFFLGMVLGLLLNTIPLLLSFALYQNFWALNINYGFFLNNLLSGVIGMIVTPYLYNKF